jgi:hypothetical protein
LAVFSQVDSFESRALCPHGPRHVMKVTRFLLLGCYSVGAASNPSELTVAPGTLRDEFAVYEQATPSGSVDGPFLFTDFTDLASDRGGIPVAAPAPNPSPDAKDDAEQGSRFGWLTDDESRFVARAQMTYAWTRKFGFDAPYTGPQSLVTHAADARGYDIGGIGELYWDDWAFRAGRGMEPTVANGRSLYYNLFRRHGDQVEIEHDHVFNGQPGAVRVLVYRNLVNAGNYAQAVALAAATGTIPDITAHRYLEAKTGYGASVEQSLSPSVALWARGMWCDCKVEQYAFTEIDNSMHIFQEYSHEHQH